MPLDGGTMKPS